MNAFTNGFLDEFIKVAADIPNMPMHLGIDEVPEEARRDAFQSYIEGAAEADPVSRMTAYGKYPGVGALIGGATMLPIGLSEMKPSVFNSRVGGLPLPILNTVRRGRPLTRLLKPLGLGAAIGGLLGLGAGKLRRTGDIATISDAQGLMADPSSLRRRFREEREEQADWHGEPDDEYYDRKSDIANRIYFIESSNLPDDVKDLAIRKVRENRPAVIPQRVIHQKDRLDQVADSLRDMADRAERNRDYEDRRQRERLSQG